MYFSAEVHGTDGGILIDEVLSGKMRVIRNGLQEQLDSIGDNVTSIIEDVVGAVENGTQVRIDGNRD